MRPTQWVKNVVVLVPAFFAAWDRTQQIDGTSFGARMGTTLLAALAFCLASSGIYVLNDLCDLAQDRLHPRKRLRPLAAGRLAIAPARWLTLLLLLGGLGLGWLAQPRFAAVLAVYLVLQFMYSFGLKKIGLLDVFMIAFGFVLRAIGGAAAAQVIISSWLLICTFLLALFLALCKRRHEKTSFAAAGNDQRVALAHYSLPTLDHYISISATATVICYTIYTLAPETVAKFGTRALGFTVPFVIFGVFRYIDLVYRQAEGERPEKVLLTDRTMIVTVLLYTLAALAAFIWGQSQ